MLKRIVFGIVVLLALAAAVLAALGRGWGGRFDSEDGTPKTAPLAASRVAAVEQSRAAAADALGVDAGAPQILFGDLHVHTTISFDAFMLNLPITGGQGAHPPADACDFARHCAALDFWSINDHAANIHPDDWRNTIDSIRQCNALAGEAENPDVVALLGWEWTQAGPTPDEHYGHKNVVLRNIDDERIPTRPIAATAGGLASSPPGVFARGAMALGGDRFRDLAARWTALSGVDVCPEGDVRSLPDDCREIAETPVELFRKLDEWGHDAIVIPHGTAWGIYTPATSSWDKQLSGPMHDPDRQTLLEVYSGHGESEPYREWRAFERDAQGDAVCPEERDDFLPMCRRAGQLVRERCLAAGEAPAECEARAAEARQNAMAAGAFPHATVPGSTGRDWLDAGQCRDCDQPAFKYRPASSAQYIAAIGNFEGPEPRHFRMGFMASSDIHTARPGTGYKERNRKAMTDAGQEPPTEGLVAAFFRGAPEDPTPRSRTIEDARKKLSGLQLFETERSQSFLYTGGLIGLHADGRDREAVWSALDRRSVYGTSGPRILLWLELLGADGATLASMGEEVRSAETPRLRVRAVGSFEQLPGCPDDSTAALGEERRDALCGGECYHPGDVRRPIARIEVVRIRPQTTPDEPVAELIDDPWRSFDCPPDPAGCEATFEDPEFGDSRRTALYYARVFEPPAPTINGATLRCEVDDAGRCIASSPCPPGDDCLAPYAPRAWSSPIWVDPAQD
jgi:hypothetical protein